MSAPTHTIEVTGRELERIQGALSSMLRYEQRYLETAKTDEAVSRWADRVVETHALIEKLERGGGR